MDAECWGPALQSAMKVPHIGQEQDLMACSYSAEHEEDDICVCEQGTNTCLNY